jgi:hypothetical protein
MSKRNLMFASAALLIVAGSAYAQNARFNVPFQFTVYNTAMPAGSYLIKSASTVSSSSSLIIQNDQTRRSGFFDTNSPLQSLRRNAQSKLVFDCYDGSCYLSQVWNGNVGRQLRKSPQEVELAKQRPVVHAPIVAAVR